MASVLPQDITKFAQPLGKADLTTGDVTISKDWYLMLVQLWTYTVAAGLTTGESALLESAEIDQGPILSFNPTAGAQGATFTASNKPGTGTTAPDTWITVYIGGVPHFIPAWK